MNIDKRARWVVIQDATDESAACQTLKRHMLLNLQICVVK